MQSTILNKFRSTLQLSTIAVLSIGLLSSCSDDDVDGMGPVVTEEIVLEDFRSVDFQIAGEVIITQGAEQEVLVTSQANIIEHINRTVSNGTWDIGLGDGNYKYSTMRIEITVPNIEGVELSGSGGVAVEEFANQGNMNVALTGSGNLSLMNIDGPEVMSVVISGSGSIEAAGTFSELDELDVTISGSGSYRGFAIPCRSCDVLISGSGSSEVTVSDVLNVTIPGSGNVRYKGQPDITSNISGSGTVINAN